MSRRTYMLLRSLITATCTLAFTALTATRATALVTSPVSGGGSLTCSSDCTAAQEALCTGGTWSQSNYSATPPPSSATEACTSPANAVSCTVTATAKGGAYSSNAQT